MSRAARCLWALEELGLGYEHIPTPAAQAKSPEHLKLNPNGHIPALTDDGFVIWESMAINLYLAEKYGKNLLWPTTAEDRGRTYQWSFWAIAELEARLLTLPRQQLLNPPEQRDERLSEQAAETLKGPLQVLDESLNSCTHLLGEPFTIADLNVASVLSFGTLVRLGVLGRLDFFSETPRAREWLVRCVGRQANQKVRRMK